MELPLADLTGIPLSELDARAGLLTRMDRKYVVAGDVLAEAIAGWTPDFDILDIGGTRSFTYESLYFDDPDHRTFVEHQQGRRQRFKVRIRRYPDTGLCFLEVKLKGPRGSTLKRRLEHPLSRFSELTAQEQEYIGAIYREHYGRPIDCELRPEIMVAYQRTTLVAKHSGERITIDRGVRFDGGAREFKVDGSLAIVEAKSPSSRGKSEAMLRALHQHPVSACSKYCLGLVALGRVDRFNRFLGAARKLRLPVAGSQTLAKAA